MPISDADAFAENARYFRTPIQLVQFADKYARWNDAEGRRETWPEAVDRVVTYLEELGDWAIPSETISEIRDAILEMCVMPSMRLLAMAGPAARRNNIAIYNCAAEGIDHPYAFVEALIISMAGAGFGYSVEPDHFVDHLPTVATRFDGASAFDLLEVLGDLPEGDDGPIVSYETQESLQLTHALEGSTHKDAIRFTLQVRDSSEGWAEALAVGLAFWLNGEGGIEFDFSQIRKKGTRLKTKGGTASGPEPLIELLAFVRDTVLGARGRKLISLEAHDIMCKIADCVVSGGVRRSAMISLFGFEDDAMRTAKPFGFWDDPALVSRKNANNSAVWPDHFMTRSEVAAFMNDMFDRGTGENGIFIRRNAWLTSPARRTALDLDPTLLTNPCGEIYLRNGQFCNLTIIVARPGMTREEYLRYARLAAIIGTIQANATYFPGLRPKWKANCEAERLLGVSIAGQADVGYLAPELLREMKARVIETNVEYAAILGINPSAATTCVKPDGNSGVLLGCSSGIHRAWATWYIKRMTLEKGGVLANVLEASGWELEASVYSDRHVHALFPMHSPGLTKQDITAIEQCEVWLSNKVNWTEHNPSCTISYHEHEREELIGWIFNHQDVIGGMAFLPAEGSYPQAPYETITKDQYDTMVADLPPIDMSLIRYFEQHDTTTSAREVACSAGACDWNPGV